jgi:hypothetical protein
MKRIRGTLHEDRYTFLTISRSFLFKMGNISDEFVEKIKRHILCSNFFPEIRAVYEII